MTSTTLEIYRQRRAAYVDMLGGACAVCGNKDRLEFDHINPATKAFDISSKLTYKPDVVLAELAKCQLLCKECHTKKTVAQGQKADHGMYSMYRHHKCRCPACKEANKRQHREWRDKKKGRSYSG